MARKRTTRDTWQIWINYGQGWEHECTELSWKACKENLAAYRKNTPEYPVKHIKRREKIEAGVSGPRVLRRHKVKFQMWELTIPEGAKVGYITNGRGFPSPYLLNISDALTRDAAGKLVKATNFALFCHDAGVRYIWLSSEMVAD